jgi:hypothetical protein
MSRKKSLDKRIESRIRFVERLPLSYRGSLRTRKRLKRKARFPALRAGNAPKRKFLYVYPKKGLERIFNLSYTALRI